jgi:hypothetical protein
MGGMEVSVTENAEQRRMRLDWLARYERGEVPERRGVGPRINGFYARELWILPAGEDEACLADPPA